MGDSCSTGIVATSAHCHTPQMFTPPASSPPLPPSLPSHLQVLDGMDLVQLIESKGSSSGKTSAEVVIKASGELPVDATADAEAA